MRMFVYMEFEPLNPQIERYSCYKVDHGIRLKLLFKYK